LEMYEILGCPMCSGNKNPHTHTYGAYRVYERDGWIKLKCKTCGYTLKRKIINGGA